ncbi:hypothetical protein ACFLS9_00640 [Bacteroidota bacterium]
MKKVSYLRISLLILLTSYLLIGCGKDSPTEHSSGLNPILWSRVEHYYGDSNILTISELLGPNGARIDNIIPGKYVARGTYDLTGNSFTTGEISLGFLGNIITGEGGKTAEEKDYIIPDGQLRGSYEVIQEIIRLDSGSGNPVVEFVIGSTMYDRITLY